MMDRQSIQQEAERLGLECDSWSLVGGKTRYRFFENRVGIPIGIPMSFFEPDGLYTALGREEALTWLKGFESGIETRK